MSQRDSGYERQPFDNYETPAWVTSAIIPHLPARVHTIWEPACGSGKMSDVLKHNGFAVIATDIIYGDDFLLRKNIAIADAIITNPPYLLATEFIERALQWCGVVAMLLRTDFDHAKTRQRLFGQSKLFSKKLVLTKRIQWFEEIKAQPSFNHAWFIWDRAQQGPPTLAYGP